MPGQRIDLKLLLKRGALLAAANWPVIAIQFVAETTFQVLLAVPVIGAAILVAVLLGADLAELLQGSLRDIFTTIASALMSEPVALVAFVTAFAVVLLGGSVLMFLVKGGTVDVLIAAHAGGRSHRARADHHRRAADGVEIHAGAIHRRMRPAVPPVSGARPDADGGLRDLRRGATWRSSSTATARRRTAR